MQTMLLKKCILTLCTLVFIIPLRAATPDIQAPVVDPEQIQMEEELKRPSWLTELSVTTKEIYDSNVFYTDANRAGFPKIANVSTWGTMVNPRASVDFAEFLDKKPGDTAVQQLSVVYAPEIMRYYDASSENFEAHRFGTRIKGKVESFSYDFDNTISYVDGNRNTPQYNQISAWAAAFVRERRSQVQDKGKLTLRNDWDKFFVRGVSCLVLYDMNTYQYRAAGKYAGWLNYEDRYDVNGGVDVGYKITPDFAATLGYRYGHQYQQAFSWDPTNSTNDYNRVLFGVEGKPLKWLKVEVQGGPDIHEYDPSQMQPGHREEITRFYYDGNISAQVTAKDVISLSAKQWQWVSSVGITSYEERLYNLTYKRQWTKELSSVVGFQALGATYDAPTIRNDWQYAYSTGLRYEVNEHLAFTADYSYTRGENAADDPTLAPGREYEKHLVSLGVRGAF